MIYSTADRNDAAEASTLGEVDMVERGEVMLRGIGHCAVVVVEEQALSGSAEQWDAKRNVPLIAPESFTHVIEAPPSR